ncbi:carbon storage regulator, partial [Flavonifractor plautii]|uniref:carbon storage regulator n=1 Tax=Flavonifractor plautii TaxID=292800 RepID=UPI0021087624
MLQLSLRPGEYLTIPGDIVVQLAQLSGSRAFLRVEADRSIPIVRGKVLERSGAPRP